MDNKIVTTITDIESIPEINKTNITDEQLKRDYHYHMAQKILKSMLEKARSAKIGITLAFQSLEQVTASAGSDAMVNSLLDTCGNFIFPGLAIKIFSALVFIIRVNYFINLFYHCRGKVVITKNSK